MHLPHCPHGHTMHRPTQALRRGYAVLALTAKNERSQCWSSGGAWQTNDHSQVGQLGQLICSAWSRPAKACLPPTGVVKRRPSHPHPRPQYNAAVPHNPHPSTPPPTEQAMTLIANFLLDHKLDGKPLYLHGMSSGATFALKLPRELHARQADLERCKGSATVSAKSERSKTKSKRSSSSKSKKSSSSRSSRRDLLVQRRSLQEEGEAPSGLGSINCKELPAYQFPAISKMQLILRQLRGIISSERGRVLPLWVARWGAGWRPTVVASEGNERTQPLQPCTTAPACQPVACPSSTPPPLNLNLTPCAPPIRTAVSTPEPSNWVRIGVTAALPGLIAAFWERLERLAGMEHGSGPSLAAPRLAEATCPKEALQVGNKGALMLSPAHSTPPFPAPTRPGPRTSSSPTTATLWRAWSCPPSCLWPCPTTPLAPTRRRCMRCCCAATASPPPLSRCAALEQQRYC